jgi:hypothetical protein
MTEPLKRILPVIIPMVTGHCIMAKTMRSFLDQSAPVDFVFYPITAPQKTLHHNTRFGKMESIKYFIELCPCTKNYEIAIIVDCDKVFTNDNAVESGLSLISDGYDLVYITSKPYHSGAHVDAGCIICKLKIMRRIDLCSFGQYTCNCYGLLGQVKTLGIKWHVLDQSLGQAATSFRIEKGVNK